MNPDTTPRPAGAPPWPDRLLAAWRRRGWRGLLLLQAWLPSRARRGVRVPTRYGSQFRLFTADLVDSHVITEGFYESEVLEAVRPHLGAGRVLWVIGANFGLHAVTAKCLSPATTVVAFEPSPVLGARLLENGSLNGVAVDLHAYALAGRDGVGRFFANSAGNPGMSTLHPHDPSCYDQSLLVATRTAASVIAAGAAPFPQAVILDAEGAEEEILTGFGPHLADPRLEALVFEADGHFLGEDPPSGLRRHLNGCGFDLRPLARREATGHTLSNYVATRPPGRAAAAPVQAR